MRLLNARTFELVEHSDPFDREDFPYAILSHTWGRACDEVSFTDIQPMNLQQAQLKPGFAKIRFAAEQAVRDGLDHVWIDTCCIDKSSSADLSESINSMYRWYEKAEICYVYLSDVRLGYNFLQQFRESRWFTRAWTLQELIAPVIVKFFDRDWTFLGDRQGMRTPISKITRIDAQTLLAKMPLQHYSIAKRMSWAAGRQATRSEDIAYSLLGIFEVHMPMLYGEGPKAFMRLQEEIIKTSTDHSIFAWEAHEPELTRLLLAPSPQYFEGAGDIERVTATGHRSYQLTNSGLDIELNILTSQSGHIQAVLNCKHQEYDNAIVLELQFAYNVFGVETAAPRMHNAYFVGSQQPGYIRRGPRSYENSVSDSQRCQRLAIVNPASAINLDRSLNKIKVLRGTRIEDVQAAQAVRALPRQVRIRLGTDLRLMSVHPQAHWHNEFKSFRFDDDHNIDDRIDGAVRVIVDGRSNGIVNCDAGVSFGVQRSATSTTKWISTHLHSLDSNRQLPSPSSDACSNADYLTKTADESCSIVTATLATPVGRYEAAFECKLVHGRMNGTLSVHWVAT